MTDEARRPGEAGEPWPSEPSVPDEPAQPELPPAVALPPATAVPFLETGEIEIVGRLVQASNVTLLVAVHGDVPGRGETVAAAVYKPIRGERPLWDFPDGTLAHREVAAFIVSQASGWDVVPPTVFRDDGPVGPGMLQLWVEVREDRDVVELVRAADPRLRRIALFDAVVNNADRKAGHLLVRDDGMIQGVDHGVTFSIDPKLRTVLWSWRGTTLADREMEALALLRRALPRLRGTLEALLAPAELVAVDERIEGLMRAGRFPQPHPDWPAVPWPWY
ncbi:MAG: SCO1664 family protein [Chloroflexi bacterium]|nr:SCO1664 family protein [Chloroflexota bacterium]